MSVSEERGAPARHSLMRGLAVLGLVAAQIGLASAAQAAPVSGDGDCEPSGTTVTCTFSFTGAEQSFVVPDGVTALDVVAIGAAGGSGLVSGSGGLGAKVNGTLAATPGQTLYVLVGGTPTAGSESDCYFDTACVGGFNGGGSTYFGGGGGGASDIRTLSSSEPTTLTSRLIVSGGGGGGGESWSVLPGGAGGDAGSAGENGSPGKDFSGAVPTGGGAGGQSAGGAGGSELGQPGVLGIGGGGGSDTGGAGGGGWYGGGGGGNLFIAGSTEESSSAGGGGGGSSLVPAGGTESVTSETASVTISFDVPTSTHGTSATPSAEPGAPIAVAATLSGGIAPSGVLSFSAYGPDDDGCDGPAAFVSNVPVQGAGDYHSAPFATGDVGAYRWVVTYSGDTTTEAWASACGDEGMTTVIREASVDPGPGSTPEQNQPPRAESAPSAEADPRAEADARTRQYRLGGLAVAAPGRAGAHHPRWSARARTAQGCPLMGFSWRSPGPRPAPRCGR